MQYVIIEFYANIAPCVADADWPLTAVGEKLGLPWNELAEQPGPVIGSVYVTHHSSPIAVYRELRPLIENAPMNGGGS